MTAKLVRNKIPELMVRGGQDPVTRVAGSAEYLSLLREKLIEEVDEFLTSDVPDTEELVDILEVVRALAAYLGVPFGRLNTLRLEKALKRGDFFDRIVLEG